MKRNEWEQLQANNEAISLMPEWLASILKLPFEKINSLPEEPSPKLEIARPKFELKEVTRSYLDFLTQQIELNARDEGWNKILKTRHQALKPFLGKTLYTVSINRPNDVAYLRIDPSNQKIVHWEVS